jgi:predicted ATPase
MIRALHLKNFKRFDQLDLPFAPLTLLAGLNGMGKSSVIQSLLVLLQSYRSGNLEKGYMELSGNLVELGTAKDVLYDNAKNDKIEIGFGWNVGEENKDLTFSLTYDPRADQLCIEEEQSNVRTFSYESIPFFSKSSQYLCAERLGPRKALPISTSHVRRRDIGKQGEYVLHALQYYEDQRIGEKILLLPDDPRSINKIGGSLKTLTEAWLNEIAPGVGLSVKQIPETDIAVAAYNFTRTKDVVSPGFRPTNVGFGLSYVLPVIVSCLLAEEGDLLLIENPESHIHPKGQTWLGELLSCTVKSGVQVIVETHSDHLMNGIRLSVHERILEPQQVAFHYFEQINSEAHVVSPQIDEEGRLDLWPKGFFDEFEDTLARLISRTP